MSAAAKAIAFICTIDLAGSDSARTLIFLSPPETALEAHNARSRAKQADFDSLESLNPRSIAAVSQAGL